MPQDFFELHQAFFSTGKTRQIAFRYHSLERLKTWINQHESELLHALRQDVRKSDIESYTSEVGFILNEIDHALRHLHRWMKPEKRKTPWLDWPGKSRIYPEPKGVVLIIGPWNYPFLLVISPLIGALAAGNCAVLKPSEFAPHTSQLLEKLIHECFPDDYCRVVQGNADVTTKLLDHPWDHIFFTGSTWVGRYIMESAARYLSPVTLELGGKNPCIVMEDIDPTIAADRIVWGKLLNAGQTCVAPDHLLVHNDIADDVIENIIKTIQRFYGLNPQDSPNYSRIVNDHHFHRLMSYMKGARIIFGGRHDPADLYIAPTLITDIEANDRVMHEEIFGPILPVLTFDDIDKLIDQIRIRPKPLALYLFTKNKACQEKVRDRLSSGSLAINDTLSQIINIHLPFGGIGESGIGAYHGRTSFDCFTHYKSVFIKGYHFHHRLKYPPYRISLHRLKRLFKIMGK